MTMMKSPEKKSRSRAHSVSASDSGSEIEAGPSNMSAEQCSLEKSSGSQSSRKRKRADETISEESGNSAIVGDSVSIDGTETFRSPKVKKKKVSQPVASNSNVVPESQGASNDSPASPVKEEENEDFYSTYIDPTTASLLFEDLTEDEDVWLFQCPKFINPEILVGNKINLSKKSTVECKVKDDSTLKLDSYPVNYEPGTSKINIVLPSRHEGTLKISVSELQGKIILTEQVAVPEIDYEAIKNNAEKEEISFPSNLKIRHPLLGIDSPPRIPKRKKKRQSNVALSSLASRENESNVSFDTPSTTNRSKRKSDRNINEDLSSVVGKINSKNNVNSSESQGSSAEAQNTSVIKSKKKKKQSRDSYLDEEMDSTTPSKRFTNSSALTTDEELSFSHNQGTNLNSSMNNSSNLSFRDETVLDGIDPSVCQEINHKSKKKKRKHQNVDANDLEALTPEIKVELQNLDVVVSDSGNNSPPKSKKKKHDKTVPSDSETVVSDFKYEPRDPLEITPDDLSSSFPSKSKKKKKRYNSTMPSDSETVVSDFKYEPIDPLEITSEDLANSSRSKSKKKKKERQELLLNNTKSLQLEAQEESTNPSYDNQIVFKTEFDDLNIETDSTLTKSHRKRKKLEDSSINNSVDSLRQDESQLNSESLLDTSVHHESSGKRKRKSIVVDEINESCHLAEESMNTSLDQSSNSLPGKSKKKKKHRLADEINDASDKSIKIELDFDGGNQLLPSFLDTLSNNYEFSTPDSCKSAKKKKKKNKADVS